MWYFYVFVSFQRVKSGMWPSEKWQPNDTKAQEEYKMKLYCYPQSRWKRFVLNILGPKKTPFF